MRTLTRHRPLVEEDYLELVRRLPLRPIRTKAEHRQALGLVTGLSAKGDDRLTDGEADYLAALARFVADYEQASFMGALEKASPLEILRHLMEERGMTPGQLGDVLGSRPAVTMILKGQRQMSKAQIVAMGRYFGVDPSVFL